MKYGKAYRTVQQIPCTWPPSTTNSSAVHLSALLNSEVIGEQTFTDAILDSIIHDSHRLELKGESMQKKRTTLTEEITEKDN